MEKRQAPCGLQDVLNRLAFVALSNKPVCFYKCFAEALERDVIHRTLLEIQAEQCKFVEFAFPHYVRYNLPYSGVILVHGAVALLFFLELFYIGK